MIITNRFRDWIYTAGFGRANRGVFFGDYNSQKDKILRLIRTGAKTIRSTSIMQAPGRFPPWLCRLMER